MYFYTEYFIIYHSFFNNIILMDNNMHCKVVGIGSIQIKIDDRNERIIIDGRHISNL